MKTIIAGSRDILPPRSGMSAYEWMRAYSKALYTVMNVVNSIIAKEGLKITEVVSGTAKGVDRLGEAWANKNKVKIKPFPANWNKYGKSAGFLRNSEMADYADVLIIIWDGKSKGSKMMKEIAEKEGLKVYEHIFDLKEIT